MGMIGAGGVDLLAVLCVLGFHVGTGGLPWFGGEAAALLADSDCA